MMESQKNLGMPSQMSICIRVHPPYLIPHSVLWVPPGPTCSPVFFLSDFKANLALTLNNIAHHLELSS